MPCEVIVTRDFDHMSEVAARFLLDDLRDTLARKPKYVVGFATGNTPTGFYKHLAKSGNDGAFDPSRVVSFNLDEYVGLPGENPQQRTLHPQSYTFFMVQELFGLLRKKFAETNVPWGILIDQERLAAELEAHREDWTMQGTKAAHAIVISTSARSPYLRWIREKILVAYERKIENAGGIDLQVVGVGQRGHVGFHEAGIPFDSNTMLLVKLDENTIANAIQDGHFASRERSPAYAVSMGAPLIFRARTVMLMANGSRKAEVVAESLLREPDCAIPISYGQTYARQGGRLLYVLDKVAAARVLQEADAITRRGALIRDISGQGASVRVEDLRFSRDPKTGLMG
ncbi:MAG: glucosamine-6-phosphate deaminase [Verrucomicrobiota bacterium]